ncbi:unnamed protein product [Moneuplotes crassus]|uniref:Uncharacterized protein n=1 Tax=Euplotes crassus TaxID=5936 RepID=A0AAD2D2N6_EUPCR|nr:unnamed protein product [Moneuplotes crassus]
METYRETDVLIKELSLLRDCQYFQGNFWSSSICGLIHSHLLNQVYDDATPQLIKLQSIAYLKPKILNNLSVKIRQLARRRRVNEFMEHRSKLRFYHAKFYNLTSSNVLSVRLYLPAIIRVLSNPIKYLGFSKFKFNSKHMNVLFKSLNEVSSVKFTDCYLDRIEIMLCFRRPKRVSHLYLVKCYNFSGEYLSDESVELQAFISFISKIVASSSLTRIDLEISSTRKGADSIRYLMDNKGILKTSLCVNWMYFYHR